MHTTSHRFARRLARSATLCIAAGTMGLAAQAQPPATSPVPSVGAMQDIPGAHETPDPALHYKLVFDVQSMADGSDEISPALQSIGALLNTFRHYGVPADHIEATAVFHGKTIVLVTRDEIYTRRTGSATNPNLGLLKELASAGVALVVCGQSARAQHYAAGDLIPSARVNLSATVTFLNLQTRGFVKIEE